MTIHRIDEEIVLVAWKTDVDRCFGLLHVQRPRSQKGVGYCGIRIPLERDVQRINRLRIPHPFTFPLEIRPERDLRKLCSKCASGFGDCVAEEYDGLKWVDVPDVWRAILARAHRPPFSNVGRLARETRDILALPTDPRENRAFGDAITAEENVVAEDDSLERQDLDAGRTWDND